jgi:hypothetical protein
VRAAWLVGLAASGVLLSAAAAPAGQLDEPVVLTVSAPAAVALNSRFTVQVSVEADAGALDIAAQPLRIRVRLEPECGGSFAGTDGPTAIDSVLPAPAPGAPYSATATGSIRLSSPGAETICAFLEDAQERQFATNTESTLVVGPACASAARKIARLRGRSTKLRRRVAHLRRARRHAHGRRRQALSRRLHVLHKRRRALAAQMRRAKRRETVACGVGGQE